MYPWRKGELKGFLISLTLILFLLCYHSFFAPRFTSSFQHLVEKAVNVSSFSYTRCMGCMVSDVSWGPQVFLVYQDQIPTPRRPSRGWSGPDLWPSSNPQICPLHPKLPGGFFCGFSNWLNGPHFGHSWNAQPCENFAEWASGCILTSVGS